MGAPLLYSSTTPSSDPSSNDDDYDQTPLPYPSDQLSISVSMHTASTAVNGEEDKEGISEVAQTYCHSFVPSYSEDGNQNASSNEHSTAPDSTSLVPSRPLLDVLQVVTLSADIPNYIALMIPPDAIPPSDIS